MVITKTEKIVEGTYAVTSLPCPVCGASATVEIASQKLFFYNQGASISIVLEGHPADVRERFISGYCGSCWSNLFGSDEED